MRYLKQSFIGIFVIVSIITISPIFYYFNIPAGILYLTSLSMIIILKSPVLKLKLSYLLVVFLLYLLTIWPAIYWTSLNRLVVPMYFLVGIFTISLLSLSDLSKITSQLTKLFTVLLLGAVSALCYKLLGGSEYFYIENPDGRLNFFIPFTFSNSVWANLVRPAGIFDEPGAFSFFICGLVTLRHLLGFDERNSLLLMLLGMVTMSLAQLVFLAFFMLSMNNKRQVFVIFIPILIGCYVVIVRSGALEIFYDVFLIRFQLTSEGYLHGDNRSKAFFSALGALLANPELGIYGTSDYMLMNPSVFNQIYAEGSETGANPLNLILRLGFVSFFYYLTLGYFLIFWIGKNKKYFVLVGFAALLLQRDYIYVIGYSVMSALILVACWKVYRYEKFATFNRAESFRKI